MHAIVKFIVSTVGSLGYAGIFFMMFLESSFFPFPSEVVMVPAGYLAHKGNMSFTFALAMGILGSIAGAVFNYYLAYKFGRPGILKLIKEDKLKKLEDFFENHGHISTFTGRLIPGVRQYISLPAGLAKMNLFAFIFYTALGAGIWVFVLTLLGYIIGQNEYLIKKYLHQITIITIILVAILIIVYIKVKKRKKSKSF
jgi:membrane protein DedA with SNARE-associated domain